MADVTASEITVISRTPIGQQGYDLVIVELFIEHTFVDGDQLLASLIPAASIFGILGYTRVDSSNIATSDVNATDIGVALGTARSSIGEDVRGSSVVSTDITEDFVAFGSGVATDEAMWLTLLVKVN